MQCQVESDLRKPPQSLSMLIRQGIEHFRMVLRTPSFFQPCFVDFFLHGDSLRVEGSGASCTPSAHNEEVTVPVADHTSSVEHFLRLVPGNMKESRRENAEAAK